jgi:hypothetical protein
MNNSEKEHEEPTLSPGAKMRLAAGGMLPVLAVDLVTHAGWEGLVIGGVLVGLGAYHSPALYRGLKDMVPFLPDLEASTPAPRATRERTFVQRLLGTNRNPHSDENEEEPDELASYELPRTLALSPELQMEPDELVCKSLFIAGQRRSGKTTLGARIAEQIGAQLVPMFIPDSEGDYLTVYDFLPRGMIAGAPDSYDPDRVDFWPVTPEDADILGFNILYERRQVILDMSTFDGDDAWRVVVGVIRGMFAFANQYPQYRCPVEVFLDEAQKYLPQNIAMSHVRDTQVRDELLQAYTDVITTGGKRGITPVILSQRLAETNNQIMAQAELRFILRQTHDTDLARAMKHVKQSVATPEQIATFAQGQGVFVGNDGSQFVTRFYERESDGGRSGTPQTEDARRVVEEPLPARYNIAAQRSAAPVMPASYRSPEQERHTSGDLIAVAEQMERGTRRINLDSDPVLKRAYELYQQGYTTSRPLGAAMGTSHTIAQQYLRTLRLLKLI